jgi:amidohydrolase
MVDFIREARDFFPFTQQLRRDFHRNPELGFQEVRTAGIVSRHLTDLGLEVSTGVGRTGVVAMLEGARPGPVLLVRFDIDALPIQEETGAEYASQTPGVMHACGHDGHTAIGLTVARMLEAHKNELNGSVKFVFQPAEEGLGGAKAMVEDGVLENPKPDRSFSLHLWNDKPLGWIGITPGPTMAASDRFTVKLTGRGGHGAAPHLGIDPITAGAQVISALQNIVSRNINPLEAAVVTVTSMIGGQAFNVIPESVELRGTIRSYKPEIRTVILERFEQIVHGVSEAMGCLSEVEFKSITPTVHNDPELSKQVFAVAQKIFPGAEISTEERTMGSEDMAFMMQDIPGCYFFIGSADHEQGLDAGHHHPKFDFNEDALVSGSALMASVVLDFLG